MSAIADSEISAGNLKALECRHNVNVFNAYTPTTVWIL